MADESPTGLDIQRENAQWADTFEGGTTNLAQRARHARDKVEYAQGLLAQREMEEARAIQSDRVKQSFYFNTEKLKVQKEVASEKIVRDRELHQERLDLIRQQAATSFATEKAKNTTVRVQEEVRRQTAEDTTAFTAGAAEALKIHRAGTPGYMNALAELRVKHPAVDKALFDDMWKTTNSDLPAEEVARNLQKAREVNPNDAVTASSTGAVTVSAGNNENAIRREIQTYENLRSRAIDRLKKADETSRPMLEEDLKYHSEQIAALQGQLAGQTAPAAAPADAQVKAITSKEEYDSLPSGSTFQWNGKTLTKK